MGIDRTAFACYGVQIELNEDVDIDQLDSWLHRNKIGLGYREWGSRSYGGDGGFLVCDKGASVSVDFNDGCCTKIPERPVDPVALCDRIDKAIADGAPFKRTSEVAWWVGGHTW